MAGDEEGDGDSSKSDGDGNEEGKDKSGKSDGNSNKEGNDNIWRGQC